MPRKPSSAPPTLAQLGPLERQMLDAVWALGECTVRELVQRQNAAVAYTTVMTTLDRLYHKQILSRVSKARAFRYKARFTKEEMCRTNAEQAIRELLRSPLGAPFTISYLVEAVTEHDVQLLDQLQKAIEHKRSQLRK